MIKPKNWLLNLYHRYLHDTAGATMMVFALSVPVVVGAMGMSVDMARNYLAKERLTHALDAAALAGAGSSNLSLQELTDRVNAFYVKNFPADGIGTPGALNVAMNGNKLKLSATVAVDSTFMSVLGIDQSSVAGASEVQRDIQGIDVALVLDVTGSMSTNNNIAALRTAAANFTDILCPNENCVASVKIGLVPFSSAVNVGPYGLGKNPDNTAYDAPFVNNPLNLSFSSNLANQWRGCVLEHATPKDTQNSDGAWKWDMYRRWIYANDGVTKITNSPNNGCNSAYILPLTTKKATIKNRIAALNASGNTLSNVGMVWGYRVLSPEAPFREGAAFHDPDIRKVVLLMTDGDNNIGSSAAGNPPWNSYSAYGHNSVLHMSDNDLDQRLSQTCENMKEDGVIVYTVTFTSGINNATKAIYRGCASDENKYIDAPDQLDLIDAFEVIAAELSNLYISE